MSKITATELREYFPGGTKVTSGPFPIGRDGAKPGIDIYNEILEKEKVGGANKRAKPPRSYGELLRKYRERGEIKRVPRKEVTQAQKTTYHNKGYTNFRLWYIPTSKELEISIETNTGAKERTYKSSKVKMDLWILNRLQDYDNSDNEDAKVAILKQIEGHIVEKSVPAYLMEDLLRKCEGILLIRDGVTLKERLAAFSLYVQIFRMPLKREDGEWVIKNQVYFIDKLRRAWDSLMDVDVTSITIGISWDEEVDCAKMISNLLHEVIVNCCKSEPIPKVILDFIIEKFPTDPGMAVFKGLLEKDIQNVESKRYIIDQFLDGLRRDLYDDEPRELIEGILRSENYQLK